MDFNLIAKWVEEFFVFNPKQPFIFTSPIFWVFFAIVLSVDAIVYKQRAIRHAFLFVASMFFYYKTTDLFFLLLLFTALWDFIIGKKIAITQHQGWRKFWLSASVIMNLSILFYFKYAYFFTDSFNSLMGTDHQVMNIGAHWSNSFFGTHFTVDKIVLPVGISFFTFQSISYTVEIYRGVLQPVKRFTDFAFFVSFFPQLVAGPIVRSTDFIPQLYKEYSLTRQEFGLAVFWILNGLVKKIFLSDYIAVNFIDRIFENPNSYTGFENLMAIYGYSLQVYADFSGYTDMAIGIAMLMGFYLTKNFDSPYKATSVADFWRRWHMSLSNWLKDYLYIPLGGNQKGSIGSFILLGVFVGIVALLAKSIMVLIVAVATIGLILLIAYFVKSFAQWCTTNLNLMLTMLIGGFWHGASWNFIIWGGLNGLGLVFYKLWNKISPWKDKSKWYFRMWAIFLTFTFITLTRVWFRAGSNNSWAELDDTHDIGTEFLSATTMLERIFMHMDFSIAPEVIAGYWKVFMVILVGMIIHWLPTTMKEKYRSTFSNLPIPAIAVACLVTIFFVYQVLSADLQPFIYFQF
jgi:D-alanyl-lipoteichoic acid acyltransferase DltB (MBOAT superfamily)